LVGRRVKLALQGLAARFGPLLASAGLACAVSGCRIDSAGPAWLETHGGAVVSAIAASPRGVIGAGTARVYYYPGVFGQPWAELLSLSAQKVAASPSASYALDSHGYVWRASVGAGPVRWDSSNEWRVTALAADEQDRLFVIADGVPKRARNQRLSGVPCAERSVAVAASERGLFVISESGVLMMAAGDSPCAPLATPGKVTSVAAFGTRLAIVVNQVAYRRVGERWEALPKPRRFRDSGVTTEDVKDVAQSKDNLWVRDDDGFVYILSDST
jgi:hypothetical protein